MLSPPSVTGRASRQSLDGGILLEGRAAEICGSTPIGDGSARVLFGKESEGRGEGRSWNVKTSQPDSLATEAFGFNHFLLETFCIAAEDAASSY